MNPHDQNSNTNNTIIKSTDLKILYWNARSILKHKEEIETIIKNLDIFVCVEIWLQVQHHLNFSGFNIYRQDRTHSRGGGILFLVRKNLAYKVIDKIASPDVTFELCGLNINNVTPKFNLFACYRTPGYTTTQDTWTQIINCVTDSHDNYILMGDFNAHNVVWNCSQNDTNGNRLLQAIDDVDLYLLNSDSLTHVDFYRRKRSNLDLIFANCQFAHKITINVHDETFGSDHFPIYVNININKQMYTKKTHKLHSVCTDWNAVNNTLVNGFENFFTSQFNLAPAKEKYNIFFDLISKSIIDNTPRRKTVDPSIHRNPVPWWDAECHQYKTLRKATFKKWQNTQELNDLIEYNRLAAFFKKLCKQKKKNKFYQFRRNNQFQRKYRIYVE